MQYKTSNERFKQYGSIYEQPIDLTNGELIGRSFTAIAKKNIRQFFHFECEVYLEMEEGMASLIVGFSPDASSMEIFAVHRLVRLKPNVYFTLSPVTAEIKYKLITNPGYNYSVLPIHPPYVVKRILPNFQINEILGYYYNIRKGRYDFKGEKHNYYELTFVDRGRLYTDVDGISYVLEEKNLMIYGPGQFHTQFIPDGESCSYVTIIFEMKNMIKDSDEVSDYLLLNKVFGYDKTIYDLIQSFVQESSTQIPYMHSLMLCLLKETVIRLIQSEFIGKTMKPAPGIRHHHYQDELLSKIIEYIHETICEPVTIAEICEKFSLSRSSLQILFKENIGKTPKKYISELKLDKSCQLIREDKYTISEISLLLGFNSIHYFSRAFTQKYGVAPSEFSKQLYVNTKLTGGSK